MSTLMLPAASLSSAPRLPAGRTLFRVANYLICTALWSIGRAIFRVASNFLPALRDGRAPALSRGVVFVAGFDPAFAGRGFLALPERRFGLQPVDQKMASGEGGLAVCGGGGDEHDAVAGFEPAIAVDHQHRVERPAAMRLGLDLGKPFLGHAGIVLEGQRRNPLAPAHIPHQPDEAGNTADAVIAGGEPLELRAGIEIFALHSDHRLSLRCPAGTARPRRLRAAGARVRHNPD